MLLRWGVILGSNISLVLKFVVVSTLHYVMMVLSKSFFTVYHGSVTGIWEVTHGEWRHGLVVGRWWLFRGLTVLLSTAIGLTLWLLTDQLVVTLGCASWLLFWLWYAILLIIGGKAGLPGRYNDQLFLVGCCAGRNFIWHSLLLSCLRLLVTTNAAEVDEIADLLRDLRGWKGW